MICENCRGRIREALDHIAQERSRGKFFTLHESLSSFYVSIESGCLVCRHVWAALQLWLQRLLADVRIGEHDLECSIPGSQLEFSNRVHQIQEVAVRYGFHGPSLTASGIHFRAGELPDHSYISLLGSTSSSQTKPFWMREFGLWPTPRVRPGSISFINPDVKALGNSTASMPELWSHWYRTCSESHALCRSLESRTAFLPKRLVRILLNGRATDMLKWQVVFPKEADSVEYVTLSHCWGSHQPSKLTISTLPIYSIESPASDLPKTYQEAFEITLSLGFQHIWIDSLCIIQHDVADWREQSPQMALIYGNARCNIAATWASDGTQGCFNTRDPFMVTATTVTSSRLEEYQIVPSHIYDYNILDAPLNNRGWVVQERCLATRQLNFTKHQVYWECAELFASEQFPTGLPDGLWQEDSATMVRPPTAKPRLNFEDEADNRKSWCSLIEVFSASSLRHPADKMIALASLASEMRRRTADVYLAGHWRKDLQKQLCWSHSHLMTNRSRTPDYYAPTWSWASFKGPISTDRMHFHEHRECVYFIEILNVSTVSDDPAHLHSFSLGELHIRAISMWAKVCQVRVGEDIHGDHQDEEWKYAEIQPLTSHEFPLVEMDWDEDMPRDERLIEPERWHSLRKQRSSELLLVFVRSTYYEEDIDVQGLVLCKGFDPSQAGKFIRIGRFYTERWFLDMLTKRLGMVSGPRVREAGEIDLDDPRLVDLIHTIVVV